MINVVAFEKKIINTPTGNNEIVIFKVATTFRKTTVSTRKKHSTLNKHINDVIFHFYENVLNEKKPFKCGTHHNNKTK